MEGRKLVVLVTATVGTLFLASLVLFSWWYTIDEGERGVVLRLGAVIGTAGPGFHIKTPWIDEVKKISVLTNTWSDMMEAYSRDQQPADIRMSINFRANPALVDQIYAKYGTLDNLASRVLVPRALEASKEVFGTFIAATAISERPRLNNETEQAIVRAVADVPEIIVDGVQLEDIAFSPAYENSIEQRMLAEVAVQKTRQDAEREKQTALITVTQAGAARDAAKAQADGEAYATRERAKAEAEAIKLRGEAEAVAITARGQALRDNPLLVELTRAERWNGVLPTTMLPNGTVPFLTGVTGAR